MKEVGSMAKKNNKPYSNSRNNKNMTRVKKNADIKKKITRDRDKSLEATTKIRVDLDRLNDMDSLDTSFLEGRYNSHKNNTKNKKRNTNKKRNNSFDKYLIMKKVCYLLGTLTLAFIVVLFIVDNNRFTDSKPKKEKKIVEEKVVKNNKIVDDNYLLLGTYHTSDYDFEEFDLDYHYVKIADKGYEISDILEDMKKNVYDYNPSLVFIELGINEIREGKNIEEVLTNLKELVNNIQENRKYAEIYVELLYPINTEIEGYNKRFFSSEVSEDDIIEYNNKIKQLTKELNVHYLDVYKELSDNDKLKEEYTDDGIHLNNEGYKVLNNIIKSITGDRNEKEKD